MAAEAFPDGKYTGTIGVAGGFIVDQEGALIAMNASGAGPLEVVVESDRLIGTWSMAGETNVFGDLGSEGSSIFGNGTFDGIGSIIGNRANPNLVGTNTWTNTVSIKVGPVSSTSNQGGTEDVSEQLTDLVITCDRLSGRWDYRINQELGEIPGFEPAFHGYLSAARDPDGDPEGDAAELTADVQGWAATVSAESSPVVVIDDGLILLDQAWILHSEMTRDVPCPPDPRFLTEVTMAAQDVLTTLLDLFPGTTGHSTVRLGLSSGAIGSGSTTPEAAAALEGALRADLQVRFESLTQDDAIDPAGLYDTAIAAQLLGVDTLTSAAGVDFTPQDIIALVGPPES
jgi:hypothetical protein